MLSGLSLVAQDIEFTNRVASFSNLEGQYYFKVTLVKGDLDGLVWRDEKGGGGRICYTNLPADLLDSLGIPPERVDIARDRAEHKAVSDARYRAAMAAEGQVQQLARQKAQAERAAHAAQEVQAANAGSSYTLAAPAYPMFYYDYAPYYSYGSSLPRAPSAPSAASVPSAGSAAAVPSTPSSPSAAPGQSSGSAVTSASTLPAPSAPSAPRYGGSPVPVRPRGPKN